MSRPQKRLRPPAAHLRGHESEDLDDPEGLAVGAVERLVSARIVLTRYVRAVDLLEAHAADQRKRMTDPLAADDAPHLEWIRKHRPDQDPTPVWDQDEIDVARRLVGEDAMGRLDVRSGKTRRRPLARGPEHATYGDEEWIQLRWRPYWRLDEGQCWMDRFELGANWWDAIYSDPRFPTERAFDAWRNDMTTGHRGVIWCAPTDPPKKEKKAELDSDEHWHGRLEEPALAVVVVSSTRRPRRTARWPLYLPDPTWPAQLRAEYVQRRYAGDKHWAALTKRFDALARGDVADVKSLAQKVLRQRTGARHARRR